LDSVSYRFHIAADATIARNAVAPCTLSHADALTRLGICADAYALLASLNVRRRTIAAFKSKLACIASELRSRFEELRKAERRVGGHAAFAAHDLVQPHSRHPRLLRRRCLRHLERLQELPQEDLSMVNRRSQAGGLTWMRSVVVLAAKRRAHRVSPIGRGSGTADHPNTVMALPEHAITFRHFLPRSPLGPNALSILRPPALAKPIVPVTG
jgi:hypothetical protein